MDCIHPAMNRDLLKKDTFLLPIAILCAPLTSIPRIQELIGISALHDAEFCNGREELQKTKKKFPITSRSAIPSVENNNYI